MEEDAAALADELQFVVGALVRQMRSVSPAHDISLSQVSVLKRLDREGPHTVADLARLDKITHQSITVSVDALADRGLVRRVPDPGDRRRKLVTITGDGLRLLTERREAGAENLAMAIASRLTGTERAHLARAVPLIRRMLRLTRVLPARQPESGQGHAASSREDKPVPRAAVPVSA